jgi:uncharacterized membrane protein YhdT
MTGDKSGVWLTIIVGLVLAVFADPIGRYQAKGLTDNPRPFQMIVFFAGLLAIIIGILSLLGVF